MRISLNFAAYLGFNFWISLNFIKRNIFEKKKLDYQGSLLINLILCFSYFSIDAFTRSLKVLMLGSRELSPDWVNRFFTILMKWLLKILAITWSLFTNVSYLSYINTVVLPIRNIRQEFLSSEKWGYLGQKFQENKI